MSISKRLRVIWAAISQDWKQHKCQACGQTQWVEGKHTWNDEGECLPCETKAFEAWESARNELQQRINRSVA